MSFLNDALDTLGGYGKSIGGTVGSTLKGVGDATVSAINTTIANAGKPATAVPEQHAAVATGQNSDGSTVIPLPSTPAGTVAAATGMPAWAIALLAVSGAAVVGGVLYVAVKK